MESITWELAVAEGDPFDRSLGCMIKSGRTLLLARSTRLSPQARIGEALTWIDRVTLAWVAPNLHELEHIHDTWDELVRAIGHGEPFPV